MSHICLTMRSMSVKTVDREMGMMTQLYRTTWLSPIMTDAHTLPCTEAEEHRRPLPRIKCDCVTLSASTSFLIQHPCEVVFDQLQRVRVRVFFVRDKAS